MSGSKQRFRRISLNFGRKKSPNERYMDLQRDSVADQNGENARTMFPVKHVRTGLGGALS